MTQTLAVALTGVRRLGLVAVVTVAFGGAAYLPGVLPAQQLPSASAEAAVTIVIKPGGIVSGYSPSSVTVEQGGVLKVVNQDSMVHTVTSVVVDAEGDPLFDVSVGPRADQHAGGPGDPGGREVLLLLHPAPQHARHPGRDRRGRRGARRRRSSSRRCASPRC